MKDIDFKDKSSRRIFGKGVVIVIVVFFSSLSFVLGYFVGKIGREDVIQPAARAPEAAALPVENPALQPVKQPPPSAAVSLPADQPQSVPSEGPNQPSPEAKTVPAPAGVAGKEASQGAANKPLTLEVRDHPKAASAGEAGGGQKEPRSVAPKQASADIYTVQLGALKNAGEAKRLRQRLEKKGYKTYLSVTKNGKHEKIYKIRVGEFKEKKQAEVLALKMKKAEGLKTFVTVKN